ncbi:MAG TPA: SCO family protein [Thermoanaerobaculia bacterium]
MTWRSFRFISRSACLAAAALCAPAFGQQPYVRSVAEPTPPDVVLVDMDGTRAPLRAVIDEPGPVFLQFIFTTCPTVCPALSATFAATQGRADVRLVSISIDPEHDTPERLREYARRFQAGPRWRFLTGRLEDVVAVQKAFEVYRSDKMQHEPSTFLRAAPDEPWLRLTGQVGPADLIAELQRLMAAGPDPELGRRIYREGLVPSGEPLRARLPEDVELAGPHLACSSCHRRSGFGASEGGTLVPPVTGPLLFEPRRLERADLFRELYQEVQSKTYEARVRDPRLRPAYTGASLAHAVRDGLDPAGRQLDSLMPRYRLSDEDMGHLTAYLRTLSAAPSPGVDAEAIHFAAVFTGGVPSAERQAMLAVMEAFFRRKNADTEGLRRHAGGSPWYKDDLAAGFRKWVLHVWDLQGPAATWRGQLEAHVREQSVFALLSGAGEWGPVHDFCERNEVPCLFPSTLLPAASPGAYTLYLSRGLIGDAEALARYLTEPLTDKAGNAGPARVVQVYRKTEEGLAPARALRAALADRAHVEDLGIAAEARIPAALRSNLGRLSGRKPAADLVLWLNGRDVAALTALLAAPEALAGFRQVILSYDLLEPDLPALPAVLRDKIRLIYPYTLPGKEGPHVFRARAWLRSRGIARTHERVQLNTWFTLSLAEHALDHLAGSFSRDFFVESVEREAEVELNPGVFPRLSLGPGQRFASKGSYVVRLDENAPGGLAPVGEWIVP